MTLIPTAQKWIGRAFRPRSYRRLAAEIRYSAAASGCPLTRNERRLRSLKQLHRGRRCFIVGCGPSLNQTDVRRLKGEITISSNRIFLLFDSTGYRPTYFTVEDHLVARQNAGTLNALNGMTKIFPEELKPWLRPDAETIYVNFRYQYDPFPRFAEIPEREMFWGHSVTYLNLQLAYHLGCSPIYLIGIDHDWKLPDGQKVDGTAAWKAEDANHFHPDYFAHGVPQHWPPRFDLMDAAFAEARRFLDARGVAVFNATSGGKLEAFPRVEYESLFRGSS